VRVDAPLETTEKEKHWVSLASNPGMVYDFEPQIEGKPRGFEHMNIYTASRRCSTSIPRFAMNAFSKVVMRCAGFLGYSDGGACGCF
jgi:hypothetical protein